MNNTTWQDVISVNETTGQDSVQCELRAGEYATGQASSIHSMGAVE